VIKKWVLELANQEYDGRVNHVLANIEQVNEGRL